MYDYSDTGQSGREERLPVVRREIWEASKMIIFSDKKHFCLRHLTLAETAKNPWMNQQRVHSRDLQIRKPLTS